ncbi:MAG: pyroglutamyl-peptidase I [Thermoplasmatota archaeon]
MKNVLVTGFDPYGKNEDNPACRVLDIIGGKEFHGYKIETLKVPTVYYRSIEKTVEKIKEIKPEAVICVGMSNRKKISVERVGINFNDARIPDNDEQQPKDELIDEDGETAYFSTLPVREIYDRLIEEGVPAHISNTAGTFVCNHLMYGVLNHINKKDYDIKAGFVHVPMMPEQTLDKDKPSMCLDLIVKGIEIAVKTTIEHLE